MLVVFSFKNKMIIIKQLPITDFHTGEYVIKSIVDSLFYNDIFKKLSTYIINIGYYWLALSLG